MGRALRRLIHSRVNDYPFLVTGIHTATRGTALGDSLGPDPVFGPRASSIDEFLEAARPDAVVEITKIPRAYATTVSGTFVRQIRIASGSRI